MPASTPRFGRRGALAMSLAAVALAVFPGERLGGLLLNTALLAGGTLAISLPIGAMLGIYIAKIDAPGRRLMAGIMAAFLMTPLYVQAAAWRAVLGSGGLVARSADPDGFAEPWLDGWSGVIWIHAMAAVPWAALLVAAALRAVERRLEEESLLDAAAPRVLWRVSLRRAGGGIVAAAVWIVVVCATEIAVTDLYQVRTFAEEVYAEASLGPLPGSPAALATSDLAVGVGVLALVAAAGLWWIVPWLPGAASIAADATWKWRPAGGRRLLAAAAWTLVGATTFLPLVGLAWKAGVAVHQVDGQYQRIWSAEKAATLVVRSPWDHRREWSWSLACGVLAAAGATAIGLAAAWLARIRPKTLPLLIGACAVAMATPAPILGVWTIELMNRPSGSPLAPLTWLYDYTVAAPVLVQIIKAAPLAAIWLWTQFATIPQDVLEASRSEGARGWSQFLRVALPLRWPSVVAAALASLIVAVGELSATLLVAPPGVTTISIRIFQLLHYGVDDRVAALSLAIFVACGAAALAVAAAWRAAVAGTLRVP